MITVLIVEDNPVSRRLMQAFVSGDGFHAVLATSGRECMERLASDPPSLILMDVQLPDADGLELTRAIKADPATAHIPVIAVTARTSRADEAEAFAAGCDDFISKPVARDRVRSLLSTWLPAEG